MSAGPSLGSAYIQIVPSAEGIKGSITKALGNEPEEAGKNVGMKIAGFAKKFITAAAIGKFVKDSLMEGAKLQQSYIGGLETIYSGAEDQIRSYARAAAEAGISMNNYAEQAVSFGAALKQSFGSDIAGAAKAADQAIMDMADNSAKMGTDIESIQMAYQGFAKQNYTMLDNLKLGYGGTKSEMERLLATAEKATGVHYDIDNLGDVYEAIHVIQGELGIAGVAADEAKSTLSGSFAAMKASYQNFVGSLVIGEDVSGMMDGLIDSTLTFGKNLLQAFGNLLLNLPDALGHLGDVIMEKIDSFGDDPALKDAAANFIKEFVVGLVTNAPKLIAAAAGLIGLLISTIVRTAGELMKPAITAIANKFGEIKMALEAKALAAVEGLRARFAAAKAAIIQPFETARDRVKAIIDRIKGFFKFKVATPHVPLPHFSISPAGWKVGDLLKGVKPKLSVKWFAEGGILDKPTLFGAGEAGPEAIMPLDKLKDYTAIDYDRLAATLISALSSVDHVTTVDIDGREAARTIAPYLDPELNRIQTLSNRKLGYI